MDISKHLDFFNPIDCNLPVHIIGVGAIGSHVAEILARLGFNDFKIYDFDKVEPKNLANQMFVHADIGQEKVYSVMEMIHSINPTAILHGHTQGWKGQPLDGIVILSVDSVEVRQQIVERNYFNNRISIMMDFRMGLSDSQHYAADWKDEKQKESFRNSMEFSAAEAKENVPVSACGSTMAIIPTIKVITSLGASNLINFLKDKPLKKMILIDAFTYDILAL